MLIREERMAKKKKQKKPKPSLGDYYFDALFNDGCI
jgi:hypothetical protein